MRKKSVKYVFITFQNCLTVEVAQKLFAEHGTLFSKVKRFIERKKKEVSASKIFLGNEIEVSLVMEPNVIQWNNFSYTKNEL